MLNVVLNPTTLKIVSTVCGGIGVVTGLVGNIVDDKILDIRITEKVNEVLKTKGL